MKAVTVFEAQDGRRFESPAECQAHEDLARQVAEAMAPLGPQPELHGEEHYQHTQEAVFAARRRLVEIARLHYSPELFPIFKNDPDVIHPMSAAGRILTDGSGPLCRAWGRLMNINFETFREFEQPYYAT